RVAGHAAEVDDAVAEVRAYASGVEADPARLDEGTERLRALKDLERKYGDGEQGVLAYLREAVERLGALEGREAEREARAAEVARAEEEGGRLAGTLSATRAEAAPS